jgi:hypothetical protein
MYDMLLSGLNRGRGFLKEILGAPMIFNAKSVFLAVNAVYVGLIKCKK